jgi:prephenate dehydrogenase
MLCRMKTWERVAIVGVGLIGGSIGLALRERGLVREVIGVGRRESTLQQALRKGALTHTTTDLPRGVAAAELVIVCTPVEQVVSHVLLAAAACPDGALLTDVASTKASIVAELDRVWDVYRGRGVAYVGGHPLAGSEKTGPEHARANLFVGRAVVLTPTERTEEAGCQRLEQFWQTLGARVYRKSPEDHDRAVAAISHVPHLIASALAAATPTRDLPLVAGGWLDTTRVAAGDPELWRQILVDNRDDVLKALNQFVTVLDLFRSALDRDDQKQLLELLAAGKRNREAVGN